MRSSSNRSEAHAQRGGGGAELAQEGLKGRHGLPRTHIILCRTDIISLRIRSTALKMSKLEVAMKSIEEVFKHYAKAEGSASTLNVNELKTLFSKELSIFDEKSAAQLAKLIIEKDISNDIDFSEFLALFCCLSSCLMCRDQARK
ncbi:protein S100-P-like [Heptranchias perlo]|uniref:protein S100-P-like n=1 Tax=Heptranchias perlo TaxID=212740 RepID=UPI003559CD3E